MENAMLCWVAYGKAQTPVKCKWGNMTFTETYLPLLAVVSVISLFNNANKT